MYVRASWHTPGLRCDPFCIETMLSRQQFLCSQSLDLIFHGNLPGQWHRQTDESAMVLTIMCLAQSAHNFRREQAVELTKSFCPKCYKSSSKVSHEKK